MLGKIILNILRKFQHLYVGLFMQFLTFSMTIFQKKKKKLFTQLWKKFKIKLALIFIHLSLIRKIAFLFLIYKKKIININMKVTLGKFIQIEICFCKHQLIVQGLFIKKLCIFWDFMMNIIEKIEINILILIGIILNKLIILNIRE